MKIKYYGPDMPQDQPDICSGDMDDGCELCQIVNFVQDLTREQRYFLKEFLK